MSRPTVMTPQVIAKLEEAFAWGCTDAEACLWADIATPTLYLYQEKHPEFIERKSHLKQTPILKARKSVVSSLAADPKLALSFLERKKKDEFSLRTETDVTTNGKSINPLDALTVEELRKLANQ